MSLLKNIAIVFGLLASSNMAFADEVDINFTTDSGEEVVVSGQTDKTDAGDLFTPADKAKGQKVLDEVVKTAKAFKPVGEVSAHIVNHDTGISEEIVFSINVDGEKSAISLIGTFADGSTLLWSSAKN